MHPLVLSLWTLAVVVAALLLEHPAYLLSLLMVTFLLALATRVVHPWWSVVRYTVWMGLAIVVINVVASNEGTHVLLRAAFRLPLLGVPVVTLEAVAYGAAMAVRLAAIISAFTLLNLCVHPDDLLRAAVRLRLPYRSVLVASLSTRFAPVLMQDAQTIADVQRSRGLEFDTGTLRERIGNRGALILPLLSNSLDRAVQVAEAMESRAYGAAARRTFLRNVPVMPPDVAAAAFVMLALAAVIWLQASGIAAYAYYPSVSLPSLGVAGIVGIVVLVSGFAAIVPFAHVGRRNQA